MGLSLSLSNALSGMNTTQKGLEVVSRNVANAGTPGYHKQSVNITDSVANGSTYARIVDVQRAFSSSLQKYYNQQLATSGYTGVRSDFMQRVETYLGKPGDATSLDTLYQNLENSMQALSTSPDDYATRAQVVSNAQTLAANFNRISSSVQDLRQETENQIGNDVTDLNRSLQALAQINDKLSDQSIDRASRSSILDQRDRLVTSISQMMDTQVTYRPDDSVALMTNSGLSLLDKKPTLFEFRSAGSLSANSSFSLNADENGVGQLIATTPAGLQVNVFQQGLVRSGTLGGLVDLRDKTLVDVQNQLDEVASGIAQSFNTVTTDGTVVPAPTPGDPSGYSLDLSDMQPGNDFSVSYTVNGQQQSVKVVRVDDAAKLPMDKTNADGVRTIGVDFSGGMASVASILDTALGGAVSVTAPGGSVLQILDDGAGNTSDINAMTAHTTVSSNQNGTDKALSLFVDGAGKAFTNSLDGDPQKVGFSGRIAVNSAVLADNSLLVKYGSGTSLGDADRPNFLLSRLKTMSFTGSTSTAPESGNFRMKGTAGQMIAQMMNYQGSAVGAAKDVDSNTNMALDAVNQRLDDEYGVNIDEEMSRLMELQNAYAASARVVSTVQDLLNSLMQI